MRYLIIFLFTFLGCHEDTDYDYRVVDWDIDYSNLESNPKIDTSINLGSTLNLKLETLYQVENLLNSIFIELVHKCSYENDTIEMEFRNKGVVTINDKPVDLYKVLVFRKPNPIVGEAFIYNPNLGLVMFTHSHTQKRFYHKKTQYIMDSKVIDSINLDYSKDEVFEFYFSDIEIPEFDEIDASEIEDSVELDIDFD